MFRSLGPEEIHKKKRIMIRNARLIERTMLKTFVHTEKTIGVSLKTIFRPQQYTYMCDMMDTPRASGKMMLVVHIPES